MMMERTLRQTFPQKSKSRILQKNLEISCENFLGKVIRNMRQLGLSNIVLLWLNHGGSHQKITKKT